MSSREAVKVYGCCAHGFGLSWALFTLCFLIINIIVFVEPQWIGDTLSSPGVGYVGLYKVCNLVCSPQLLPSLFIPRRLYSRRSVASVCLFVCLSVCLFAF